MRIRRSRHRAYDGVCARYTHLISEVVLPVSLSCFWIFLNWMTACWREQEGWSSGISATWMWCYDDGLPWTQQQMELQRQRRIETLRISSSAWINRSPCSKQNSIIIRSPEAKKSNSSSGWRTRHPEAGPSAQNRLKTPACARAQFRPRAGKWNKRLDSWASMIMRKVWSGSMISECCQMSHPVAFSPDQKTFHVDIIRSIHNTRWPDFLTFAISMEAYYRKVSMGCVP